MCTVRVPWQVRAYNDVRQFEGNLPNAPMQPVQPCLCRWQVNQHMPTVGTTLPHVCPRMGHNTHATAWKKHCFNYMSSSGACGTLLTMRDSPVQARRLFVHARRFRSLRPVKRDIAHRTNCRSNTSTCKCNGGGVRGSMTCIGLCGWCRLLDSVTDARATAKTTPRNQHHNS